jgi:hypothetical protein
MRAPARDVQGRDLVTDLVLQQVLQWHLRFNRFLDGHDSAQRQKRCQPLGREPRRL